MKIKTKCNGCVFLGPETCRLGYKVYKDDDDESGSIFVDSYCRFKRRYTTSHNEILKEDKNVCLIINALGQNEGYILRVLPKEIKDLPGVSEVIIASNSSYSGNTLEKLKKIFQGTDKRWSIRFFKNEEEYSYDHDTVENNMVLSINHCNWYYYKKIDEKIDKDLLLSFQEHIKSDKNFLQINHGDKYIRNKYAFMDLLGNNVMNFYDKLKEYDKYEEVVINI